MNQRMNHMTNGWRRQAVCPALAVLVWLALAGRASGQTIKIACPHFFSDTYQALACGEALFSEPPWHLTFSSLPPPNGLPLGIVYEEAVHRLSPFGPPPAPNAPEPNVSAASEGRKSLTDSKLALVGSTNGSWYATGSVTWLPPLPYSDVLRGGESCHRLGPFCTKQVMGINVYVRHRTIETLYFYGIGRSAPATRFVYEESENYGGVSARMPFWNWLSVEGSAENRRPSVRGSSDPLAVVNNFSNATAPGVSGQPDFMHYSTALRTEATAIAERPSNPLAAPAAATGPRLKAKTVSHFQNDVAYHWYSDLDTGRYSFQQFTFDGDESFAFHPVLQRFVPPGEMGLLDLFCKDNKATTECDFGTIDVRSLVVVSRTGGVSVVPFYYQPTLGGSDIESRQTLRAFDDYRFRGPDLALLQLEYAFPISDPLGAQVFYDAGTVGSSAGDLSPRHFRTDVGAGFTIRLQKRLVFDAYVATGAGAGHRVGYNFTKFF